MRTDVLNLLKKEVCMTRVTVLDEIKEALRDGTNDFLCLQRVIYVHKDHNESGIRFIRRGADGKMKAQRGQANCMSIKTIGNLVQRAEKIW